MVGVAHNGQELTVVEKIKASFVVLFEVATPQGLLALHVIIVNSITNRGRNSKSLAINYP